MNEEIEQNNQEEEEELTCPECGKGFQDKRGLTSHARHIHDLNKDQILEKMNPNNKKSFVWKLIAGTGALVVALITAGRFK